MKKLVSVFLFYIAAVLLVTPFVMMAQSCHAAKTAAYPKNTELNLNKMASDILVLINQHRASIGLSKLEMSDAATKQATLHSADMANGVSPFGHDGFEDRMAAIVSAVGRLSESGENVASGQMSAQEVVEGWLNSKGHRENIEGNFKFTGIGLAKASDGRIYFTQIFYRQ